MKICLITDKTYDLCFSEINANEIKKNSICIWNI